MDYRLLLLKYINHVGYCEGISFIENHEYELESNGLTKEEVAELLKLDKESLDGLCS